MKPNLSNLFCEPCFQCHKKNLCLGNSLAVWWVGLGVFTAMAQVQSLVGSTKIQQAAQCRKKKKKTLPNPTSQRFSPIFFQKFYNFVSYTFTSWSWFLCMLWGKSLSSFCFILFCTWISNCPIPIYWKSFFSPWIILLSLLKISWSVDHKCETRFHSDLLI